MVLYKFLEDNCILKKQRFKLRYKTSHKFTITEYVI